MNISTTTTRMWAAAADLAAAIRHDWTTVSGRRWRRRPAVECPPWCGRGHVCTAAGGYPSGQHRSMPASWSTSYGNLIATRISGLDGRNRIEVRTVITLPADEDAAGLAAQGLLTAIHLTITSLTATKPVAMRTTADPTGRRVLPAAAESGGRHQIAA